MTDRSPRPPGVKTPSLEDMLAAPKELTYKGKAYELSELTLLHRCQFTRWLERRAREDAGRAVIDLPDEASEKYIRTVSRDIAGGAYEWGSPASAQALISNPKAMAYLIHLRLSEKHPEVDEEFAEQMIEGMLAEKVSALTAALEGDDPKAKAAAEALLTSFGLKLPSSAAPQ